MRYGVTLKDSISKLRPRKAGESPRYVKLREMTRPFTRDSDMIIVQFMLEDEYSPSRIALELGRDREAVEIHIEELKKSGRFEAIQEWLNRNSVAHKRKMGLKTQRRVT